MEPALRAGVLAIAFAAAAGCATDDVARPGTGSVASRCERAYAALDDAVDRAGVREGGAAPIAGFPHLRADPLLASFADDPMDAAKVADWVAAMRREDVAARLVEIRNLPPGPTATVQRALDRERLAGMLPAALLDGCSATLAERDLGAPGRLDALRAAVRNGPAYVAPPGAAGPAGVAPTSAGAARGEGAVASETTANDASRSPNRAFVPGAPGIMPGDPRALAAAAPRDALGIPRPSPETLDALFATWAPRIVVDDRVPGGRPGMPVVDASGRTTVDTGAPVVFTRAGATRFGDRVLLQLAYAAWFPPSGAPAREGAPVALVWRVTLDESGAPLLFDALDDGGARHLLFPTPGLVPRVAEGSDDRVRPLPAVAPSSRITLRLAPGTHRVLHAVAGAAAPEATTPYALAPADRLRTLASPTGATRSLYAARKGGAADAGTRTASSPARTSPESAGFDDPFLIGRRFERAAVAPPVAAAAGDRQRFF